MHISAESERQAMKDMFVEPLRAMRDSSPSAGDFSLRFVQSVALVIGRSTVLSEIQRQTVLDLCALVEMRPFPAKPWSLLISGHLDNLAFVRARLEVFLEDKRELRAEVGRVAARNADRIGLRGGARLLIYGYSYVFPILVSMLPDETKRSLQIWAPRHVRRKISEGEYLKHELERDPLLKVNLIDDEHARAMLQNHQVDTLIMSAKAIGLFNGELSVINTYSQQELHAVAEAADVDVLVVSGAYKIWPKDLFTASAIGVLQDTRRYDAVISERFITWLVTERDAFCPEDSRRAYYPLLNATMDSVGTWWPGSSRFEQPVRPHQLKPVARLTLPGKPLSQVISDNRE